jgi:hypothetical protein
MIYQIKKYVFVFFLVFIATAVGAQERNFSHATTLGYCSPIMSAGFGYHLAYNPGISLTENFGIQGQVSYSYAKITSTFLSGNTGYTKSFSLLLGPKLYLREETKTFRPYLSALAGIDRVIEKRSDEVREPELIFGLSMGVFAEINRFIVGFSAETPGFLVFKLGYKLF